MAETWYSVHVEAEAPPGVQSAVDDAAADELMDLLADHAGVVAAGDMSWSAIVSVPSDDVLAAAAAAGALVRQMAHKAGMPVWPLVRCEAVREDVLEADNARPTLPEIVSVPEASAILGVSHQRVRELVATQQDFPEPVYELRTGKLWLRSAIEAYAARRPRKPGPRPKPAVSPAEAAMSHARFFLAHQCYDVDHKPSLVDPATKRNLDAMTTLLNVYIVAEAACGSASPSWFALKARSDCALDAAASDEVCWTDADEEEVRQMVDSLARGPWPDRTSSF